MKRTTVSERGIVLAPLGRDSTIALAMLKEAGIEAEACKSLDDLLAQLDAGAGFVLVTEEALTGADLRPLSDWLAGQEEWSDLPFVLLTRGGGGLERNPAATRLLEVLGNVTFLERPFHPTTLVSLAESALRGRRRQYEARSRLQALRVSELRYRTLFESIDEGFCIIEFVDGPDGPLSDYVHVEANPAFARHAGIPDVVGKKVRDVVGDEAAAWIDIYGSVLRTGEPIRFERELEETRRFLELSAFRLDPPERRQVAVLFQDITARKLVEQELRDLTASLEERVETATADREAAMAQLREAQKLEMLGQLTGGVAHDFNNLLTPITGALDLIGRRIGNDDPRSARLIDGALQSAERAKSLVQRLLGFARRQTLQKLALDLGHLVEEMRDLIASSVGSNIELKIAVSPDLPPALGDPNQLELAILNLCVNARDAMPGGGVLTVGVEQAILGPRTPIKLPPGAYIRLCVVDTGSGMDEATLERAIEPFFSTKEIGRGTGLGLSTVQGLAAQLGGAFTLASAPGEGTRADLYLPVAKSEAEARPATPEQLHVATERSLSVLLVDDEGLVRAGTAEMLRELGHQVTEAGGAADALAQLGTSDIDVLLTDYTMPGMNGAELVSIARARRPDLKVLVITGYAGGDLELGLPHLAKPFRQSELAAALRSVMADGSNILHMPARKL